ncbi:hypothetical protein DCAR_0935709 [Daucus carota subsp. sativus]|uniref:DUF668 domain-containing protein n=1 Tax=Daucus carota subsp. sativus TaxID=79200 RepID=A0A175YHL5_DAUCS|nr:PREDICTED: uncharacterized protein LOC108200529 [Daucus carota subsp. sativus]WOH16160.1 hypothetical protein DCAR_0935709 [Daucus carota subsp. sativus]
MVAEPWLMKMRSNVSANVKQALLLEAPKKGNKRQEPKQIIGILSFEVANVMSKTVILHKSLVDNEIVKLKGEIFNSDGIKALISNDEVYLFELALAEKVDELNRVAEVVSRLGRKCSIPALQGFEHVYGDIVGGVIEVREMGFLVKDMEGMIKKMEKYVNSTAKLYGEMEVLGELEQSIKKFQRVQYEESRRAFEQKLVCRKEDVRHLKEISLWNQTYDKVVDLLARTVCTLYVRICHVFGRPVMKGEFAGSSISGARFHLNGSAHVKEECGMKPGQVDVLLGNSVSVSRALSKTYSYNHSGLMEKGLADRRELNFRPEVASQRGDVSLFRAPSHFACGFGPGRLLLECLSVSSSASKVDDNDDDSVGYDDRMSQVSGCCSISSGVKKGNSNQSDCFSQSLQSSMTNNPKSGPKNRLMTYAPQSTVGGSALALHYANVVIIIEKLLRYPHLVGVEARDDLYSMLPASLKLSLKISIKSYIKDLAIFDAPLAHGWKERLDQILKWLAPMAHNMIRWQSERNFEQQQQIVTLTNVLLLQTLYFADRAKTEAAICELLVGLNYICRYEHQQNALLNCASSFDFRGDMDWRSQH